MSKISAVGMQELHAKARKVLIRIPNVTATELSKMFGIDIRTGCNILNNIRRENIERIENEDIKDEVQKIQERLGAVISELWTIIGDEKTSNGARIYALKTLSDVTNRIHEVKMDAGIFRRHLGSVDVRPEYNLGELLQTANETDRKQFITAAKSLIGDKRKAVEGSIIPVGLAIPDRTRDLQSKPESGGGEVEVGSAA